MKNGNLLTEFSPADIKALAPTMKVGLLGTVSPEGRPHVSLIASMQANGPEQLIFGQFTEGMSKKHLRQNPQAGFLIMTLDRQLWRGKANFTHTASQGPEFEMYNNTPMFRYNAYFGVHTVFYLDLVEQSGQQPLPMGKIIFAAVQTMWARTLAGRSGQKAVLNSWTQGLFNKLDNLKFLSYVDADGFPVLVPVIQAQAAGSEQIILSAGAYGDELVRIPAGTPVAVFGMTLQMEDVLLRGQWLGVQRVGGLRCGRVQVDWVYNPMPPKPGQIYPAVELEPVTNF